jgi:hypothetical protein
MRYLSIPKVLVYMPNKYVEELNVNIHIYYTIVRISYPIASSPETKTQVS